MKHPLTDLTIVNTRPAHQAEKLNSLLKSLGAKTINFPAIEIQPISTNQVKATCQKLNQADFVVFVSANAAHCSHEYWPSSLSTSQIIATGPGTTTVLADYGLNKVTVPKKFNSEGILELSCLEAIKDKKVTIVCGKHSRRLLRESLAQRGADVTLCECYQRQCPQVNEDSATLLNKNAIDVMISTSQESLKNLVTLLTDLNLQLYETPIVVISQDMASLAKKQGWKKIVIADNPTDLAISQSLIKLKPS